MKTSLVKVSPIHGQITCYQVSQGERPVGYVWSIKELSYRGTQGWNAGIRLQDFHPIRWRCGESQDEHTRVGHDTRVRAIQWLLRDAAPVAPEPPAVPTGAHG